MAKPRLKIQTGKQYGKVTVLGVHSHDNWGHLRYHVRCDCGTEFYSSAHRIFSEKEMCTSCKRKRNENNKVQQVSEYVGEVHGTWKIAGFAGKNKLGVYHFDCQCLVCGNISRKTYSEIKNSHGKGCSKCSFDYCFVISGNVATGTLVNGIEFVIDTEDIKRVSAYPWSVKNGYIICKSSSMAGAKKAIPLHRFLMNLPYDSSQIVDHINRNPLDCRKSNLRLVTEEQNSMNCSLAANNKTGYRGVSYVESVNKYQAAISLCNKDIFLGRSKDPIECAQMYNIAATLLHPGFEGHLNNVPEPSHQIKEKIQNRCKPFIKEAFYATQPCGFFTNKTNFRKDKTMFEKVNLQHPDKIADRIAGAVVDIAYEMEDNPKIAVEVLIGHGVCYVIAESSADIDAVKVCKAAHRIAGNKMAVNFRCVKQDIKLANNQADGFRCGDNGIFKGVPVTEEQKALVKIAKDVYNTYRSDGKCILDQARLIICQSNADTEKLRKKYPYAEINPLGFWTGGTDVDTGATNRKLGSDMADSVTGGGLHGKDLSKADVSVNIYAWIKAQETHKPVELCCAIGDDTIDGKPYSEIVEIARNYIRSVGGFERFAEWGLLR